MELKAALAGAETHSHRYVNALLGNPSSVAVQLNETELPTRPETAAGHVTVGAWLAGVVGTLLVPLEADVPAPVALVLACAVGVLPPPPPPPHPLSAPVARITAQAMVETEVFIKAFMA